MVMIARRHQKARKKQNMIVFDQLIYNFDRHQANMLYDQEGELWLIDHTRSFKKLPVLQEPSSLIACQRSFYEALHTVSDDAIRSELSGLLDRMEIDAVIKRRRMVLKRRSTTATLRQGAEMFLAS